MQLYDLKRRIKMAEERTQLSQNQTDVEEVCRLKADYERVFAWETYMARQKTRARWIEEGDRNNKFYHALIRD